jgi:hypothetical protein
MTYEDVHRDTSGHTKKRKAVRITNPKAVFMGPNYEQNFACSEKMLHTTNFSRD